MVVIFNLRIVLDLRQRQQVGETCLAPGAQRGKVGNAPQLQQLLDPAGLDPAPVLIPRFAAVFSHSSL